MNVPTTLMWDITRVDGRRRASAWRRSLIMDLARAERPGETSDALASVGGTTVALAAIAAGFLALVGAGVIVVPPSLVKAWNEIIGVASGQTELAYKTGGPGP